MSTTSVHTASLRPLAQSAMRSMRSFWSVCLLGMLNACSGEAPPAAQSPANPSTQAAARPSPFVTVSGTRFYLNGHPYYFAGTNLWYGAYLGSAGPTGDRERLTQELDQLKAHGITNIRVLAMSEASELKRAVRPAIMIEPGKYDEELLQGLDYLLAEMGKRDMKAVLYLNNFWQWSGGMSQYVAWFTNQPAFDPDVTGDWNTFMDTSAKFYAIEDAQQLYRDMIAKLIGRKNSVTGVVYRDDPTIMSWQLANEPRPGSDAHGRSNAEMFIRWIDETAKYIGELAPNHLVSTGNEGSMGALRDYELFERSHRTPNVDYLTFHMWAANWQWFDPKRPEETYERAWTLAQQYLDRHIDLAGKLNKPIVLEEFGLNRDGGAFERSSGTHFRDRYYQAVFDLLHRRAAQGDAIAGSNFWAWGGSAKASHPDFMWKPGDAFMGDPPQEPQGLYAVFDTDTSTLDILKAHAAQMQQLMVN